MRTVDMVKSKYWRGRDLEGQRPIILTIADVTEEVTGRGGRQQETKCFLWFREHLKGLSLSKGRVLILELAYGPDSELWIGKRVKLSYDPTVMFGDKAVGGVKLETPAGVVYNAAAHDASWGAPAAPPGAPPPPVWDDRRQQWIIQPAAPPAAAAPSRPPPPVFNPATGQWEVVNPKTGEVFQPAGPAATAAPASNGSARPATISERVNAQHPPQGTDDGWGGNPPPPAAAREDFDDDIPF
jgi:hypothetical protein